MTKSLNQKVQLPKDAYVVRVIDEKFGPSKSSGNNMITLELEIVAPEEVKDATGDTIECGGYKFKTYFSIENDDAKVAARSQDALKDLWNKIGKNQEEVDWKNPPLFFKAAIDSGSPLNVDVILYGKKNVALNAQKQPIKIGGKDVVEYQVQVDSWHGISTVDTSARAF